VLARIADLGNRSENFRPKGAIDFKSTIPLEEIIADCLGVGVQSTKVQTKYEEVLLKASEFSILFELSEQELINLVGKDIATAVLLVRAGKVHKQAGYDGEYGKIKIFENDDRELVLQKLHQNPLF
jgi:PHP family Zn ribbon phosphoesterase